MESHGVWVMPDGSEGTRRRGGISEANWKPAGLSGRGREEGLQLQALEKYRLMSIGGGRHWSFPTLYLEALTSVLPRREREGTGK